MFLLAYLLSTTICLGYYPFDLQPSYSKCDLYYDFSRSNSNRISASPFIENTFNGQIINNNYFDITDANTIIGSNSADSYSTYTVIFDAEFPEIFTSGDEYGRYFWGADSIATINTGGYNDNQYHFLIQNGKLAIENWTFGPSPFINSPVLTTNQRYLISYVVTETELNLYINELFIVTLTLSNGGVYQPYYIKIGGAGHANRPHQKMKLYQYAFYGAALTSVEINALATAISSAPTTNTPTTIIPTTMTPTTAIPTTNIPSTVSPTTNIPTTATPTTFNPTTTVPTTTMPTTTRPTTTSIAIETTENQKLTVKPTTQPTKIPSTAPIIESRDAEIILTVAVETTSLINVRLNNNFEESMTFSDVYILIMLLSVTCVMSCCVVVFGLYLLRKRKKKQKENKTDDDLKNIPNKTGMETNVSNVSNVSISILNTEPMTVTPKAPMTTDTFGELNNVNITNNKNIGGEIHHKHTSSQIALNVPLPNENDENNDNIGPFANKHMLDLEKIKSVSDDEYNEYNDSSDDDVFNDNAYTKGGGNNTVQ